MNLSSCMYEVPPETSAAPTKVGLKSVYSALELQQLSAEGRCKKRVLEAPTVEVAQSLMVQPIDVSPLLKGVREERQKNLRDYPIRSIESAVWHVRNLKDQGISKIFLRPHSGKESSIEQRLEGDSKIISALRRYYFGEDLQITIDPFNLALNSDGTWGIKKEGKLDYRATCELFAEAVGAYAAAGADYVLTLGRFEHEVAIAKRVIDKLRLSTKIASFSTNVETTNAYAYLPEKLSGKDTTQKIYPGNVNEMLLNALIDIEEGSEWVIIKPSEYTHVLSKLVQLLRSPTEREAFLNGCAKLAEAHPRIQRSIDRVLKADGTLFANCALGMYTVSGTYFNDVALQDRKGSSFAKEHLTERFRNIVSAGEGHTSAPLIIDRKCSWYSAKEQPFDYLPYMGFYPHF